MGTKDFSAGHMTLAAHFWVLAFSFYRNLSHENKHEFAIAYEYHYSLPGINDIHTPKPMADYMSG